MDTDILSKPEPLQDGLKPGTVSGREEDRCGYSIWSVWNWRSKRKMGRRAAIGIFSDHITVAKVNTDDEFVVARINGVYVFSCYKSPSASMVSFYAFLNRLSWSVRQLDKNAEIIIAGDFNARSAAWGDWQNYGRGEELLLTEQLGLVVRNTGQEATFTGRGAGSIIDLTFVSESLIQRVKHWQVLNEENYSDHRFLVYTLDSSITIQDRSATSKRKSWITTAIDQNAFRVDLLLADWISGTAAINYDEEVTTLAKRFKNKLTTAYNFALQKRPGMPKGKQSKHWWTDEIAMLRARCTAARRKVKCAATRTNRRSLGEGSEEDVLEEATSELKIARNALKLTVTRSKVGVR